MHAAQDGVGQEVADDVAGRHRVGAGALVMQPSGASNVNTSIEPWLLGMSGPPPP
ncbi:MAG: hypothetical protein R2761_23225 [Acidimicrobiales bacterium]